MSYELKIEALTENGLAEKIIDTIKQIGQPKEIKYGKRTGQIAVWFNATLIYEGDIVKDIEGYIG